MVILEKKLEMDLYDMCALTVAEKMTGSLETESSEPGQGCTGGQGEEGATCQEGDGQICLGEGEEVKQGEDGEEGEEGRKGEGV